MSDGQATIPDEEWRRGVVYRGQDTDRCRMRKDNKYIPDCTPAPRYWKMFAGMFDMEVFSKNRRGIAQRTSEELPKGPQPTFNQLDGMS